MSGTDPVARLWALRERASRLVVGLMSGTSADGVDAALCRLSGQGETTQAQLLSYAEIPFPRALRERIFALSGADAAELCDMNVLLGEAFADAALAVCQQAGVPIEDVDLIGSHGQTSAHRPRSAGLLGSTQQIGEPAVIAERTGRPVISDFRVRDVAAGGEGAPLVPLVDHLLFRAPGRALQNIGGIANVTLVGTTIDDVLAFDNGPGNMALDAVARAASRGLDGYDVDGRRAARGVIDAALLAELHQHPYLTKAPPKSTGRELFGRAFAYPLLDRWKQRPAATPAGQPLDDLLATLTRFTAEAIARSYREHLPTFPTAVFISGGGALNPTLMAHLRQLCAPAKVSDTTELGVDPRAKEALAFAVLAHETLFGHPGNVPRATGAKGPRVLGKITL